MNTTLQTSAPQGPAGPVWQIADCRQFGGIESHLATLVPALNAAGVKTELVLLSDFGESPAQQGFARAGIQPKVLRGGVRELWKQLRQQRPQLLHTHGYKAGILGRVLGRLLQIPVVSTFHAGEPGSGLVRVYDIVDRALAPLARHCISVSQAIAKRLPVASTRLNNFVDVPERSPNPQPAYPVAFVGRLSPEKGQDLFIEMAGRLGDTPCHLFGSGPTDIWAQGPLPDNVQFHGSCAMTDIWPDIGVLVMSSRHEGLPMAALEALAHGVPVVAFAVGQLPVLIEDSIGEVVPPGDVDALAGAVQRQIDRLPEQQIQAFSQARAQIRAQYSPEAVIPAILRIYTQVIR